MTTINNHVETEAVRPTFDDLSDVRAPRSTRVSWERPVQFFYKGVRVNATLTYSWPGWYGMKDVDVDLGEDYEVQERIEIELNRLSVADLRRLDEVTRPAGGVLR